MVYYMEIKGTMVSGQQFVTYKNLGEIDNPENFIGEDRIDIYEEIKNTGFMKISLEDEIVKFYDTGLIESIELIGPLNEEEALDRLASRRED